MTKRKIAQWLTPLAGSAFAFALIVSAVVTTPTSAAADTCTWTGIADGVTASNGGNWTGCDNGGAPEATDTLVFGGQTYASSLYTINNDLGFAVAGVRLVPSSGGTQFELNTLSIADGGVVNDIGEGGSSYSNMIIGNLTAVGDVTISGTTSRLQITSMTVGGVVTIADGSHLYASKVGAAGVVVQNGATLTFSDGGEPATNYPITLGGGTGTTAPKLAFYDKATPYSFANPITLVNNASVVLLSMGTPITVNQTGSISGAGFALTLDQAASSDNSTLTLNPSSNTSATVAGTYSGQGDIITGGSGDDGPGEAVPSAPDTGFSLGLANPAVIAAIGLLSVAVLYFAGRKLVRR